MKLSFCLYLVAWLLVLAPQALALPFRSDLNRGNDLYKKGDYSSAAQAYNKLLEKRQNDLKAKFNLGDALYKEGNYQNSQKIFEELTNEAVAKDLRQSAYYNLGNSLFRQEDYKSAIKAYEEALKINAKDEDAQFNLELAKKMLQMPRQDREKQKKEQEKRKEQEQEQEQGKKKSKPGQMSREDALRILKALEDKEKHKAQKLKAGKGKADVKDW